MNNAPDNNNWGKHIEATRHLKPSKLLQDAMDHLLQKGEALELGGGALNDTKFLLSEGWHVTVVDSAPEVQDEAKNIGNNNLHVYTSTFDEYDFPVEKYELVNAMYSLSFNPPQTFHHMMEKMKSSLTSGGIFCGNIFGIEDGWKDNPAMTFLTRDQVQQLFSDMEVVHFEEVQRDNILASGTPKHWHELRVIARKI